MADTLARSLSDAKVRSAKPGATPVKLSDGGGLFLLVQPNGTKLWRYKFRLNGREGLLAIGAYPEVTLAAARDEHREARAKVAAGVNPVQARQAERLEAAQRAALAVAGSFQNVVQAWRDKTDGELAACTIQQRTREVRDHLASAFNGRSIESITRAEIAMLLRRIEAKHPTTAKNVRTHANAIFEHAIDDGLVSANPVPPPRALKRRRTTPIAVMSDARVPGFLRWLDGSKSNPETRTAFWLILMATCRRNESVGMRWDEVDLEAGEWLIPADRMKARLEHWVPLPRQAVQMLAKLRKGRTAGEFVFPHRHDSARHMTAAALNEMLRANGYKGETVHGFRSLFSTHFNSKGGNADVIERCLAHVPRDQVRAAYNRYEYRDERRAMLQSWADHLEGLKAQA